jgi:outer membrane protein assembly factor BamA
MAHATPVSNYTPAREAVCWRHAILCALLLFLNVTTVARAGQATGDIQPDRALDADTLGKGQGLGLFNDPNYLIVPIPISNPTIGSGLALAGAVLFKTDPQSSSSYLGVAGFGTQGGSWGGGISGNLAFDEDRYRAKLSTGYANVIYDFYGIGSIAATANKSVSLTQSGYLVQGLFQTRVATDLYLGVQARHMNIRTKFNLPDLAGDLLDNGGPLSRINNSVTTFGPVGTYDTRNRDYAPDSGQLAEIELDVGLQRFVADNSFFRATAVYSRYDKVMDDLVLASHASVCTENGKVPIFELCMFGQNNDLRGYAVGKFQDKAMFTAQEELRWHAFWRVGLVAFAGIGSVGHTVGEFKDILASAGGGLRFLASKDYGINVGIDGAVTKEGDAAFYIQVGEAF